ncbi:MAG: hypothetical protein BWZ11_01862 [Bacteroidetes bacterium ADurb.BinA395]|jgi:hypothetical protein|nr:MAG: hypothetical protein BWZ11_01862 [Bacteroidetes bacterium ADurb.BinA395]
MAQFFIQITDKQENISELLKICHSHCYGKLQYKDDNFPIFLFVFNQNNYFCSLKLFSQTKIFFK